MFTNPRLLFIASILLLTTHIAVGQKDAAIRKNDSLRNAFLINQSQQLQQLEAARLQDSIKKAALEGELALLKATDSTKRLDLLHQLQQTSDKEAERLALNKQKIDSLKGFVKGYAVAPFLNDSLFYVYTKIGSLQPKYRADEITNRITKLAGNYFFTPDSLLVVESETTTDIVFGEMIIMSVSDNDALWQNTTRQALAQQYQNIIGKAIAHYQSQTSWQTIAKETGLAALVLAALATLIFFIGRFFKFTKTKIEAQKDKRIKGVKIRNYQLLHVNRQLNFFTALNTVLKWIVIVIAVYFALPILFGLFPWTKGFADTLLAYVINPFKKIFINFSNYLPNLFTIIVIVIVFRYVLKVIAYLKEEVEKGVLKIPGFYADWANPTYQIIQVLLYAFIFVVIFPYLPGSGSPVFQGVSVFIGVLFTFGSSGALSNIIAGLVLTYMRPFKIGDRVKIGDTTGDIIEKTILVTRIRTNKNEIISIPNANVMGSHTINYSSDAADKGLILHTTVTIGYDVPWRDIHKALIIAASRTEFILQQPAPFVLQTSLNDFYVAYQINAYTREANSQSSIYSQLHQNIQDACNEAGIEIMSPHYHAVRDGNMTTVPSDYLPKDYVAPKFKMESTQ